VGETKKAGKIRDAIAAVVMEGKVRTYDMMRITGGTKAISQGAASTMQITDAVLAKMEPHVTLHPEPEYAAAGNGKRFRGLA